MSPLNTREIRFAQCFCVRVLEGFGAECAKVGQSEECVPCSVYSPLQGDKEMSVL